MVKLFRLYANLTAVVFTGAALGIGLAAGTGRLPIDKVQAAKRAFLDPTSDEETPEAEAKAKDAAQDPADRWAAFEERESQLREWERILEDRARDLDRRQERSEASFQHIDTQRAELRRLAEAMVGLITVVLPEEKVTIDDFIGDNGIVTVQKERVDALHQTLETSRENATNIDDIIVPFKAMENKAAARILVATEGVGTQGALSDDMVIRILRGLNDRKRGEILSEISKNHPNRAAEIVEKMVQ